MSDSTTTGGSKLLAILWEKEMTGISEKYRWLVNVFAVFFVLLFSYQFTFLWHNLVYLGPGLGDDPSTEPLKALVFDQLSGPNRWYATLFGLYLIFLVAFRAGVMFWSYFGYEKTFGKKFPIQIIPLFMLINTVGALSIPLFLGLIGLGFVLVGYDFSDGWLLMANLIQTAHQWVMMHIPTLVEMPAIAAVLCVFMMAGLVHYWLHRLGHESRVFWLLFHRHHHMSPNLCQMSTAAVFFAFPLFILFFLPYTFIFAAITKLFHAEPLYLEIFVLNSILMFTEIFGHSDVFYDKVKNNRLIKFGSMVFGSGIYHYMHHSAEEEDAVILGGRGKGQNRKVNMINLGGGFFFLWDKLFGTFAPVREKKPAVGLIGSPTLHQNPVRLALSGFAQLIYELRMNKDGLTRCKILFGPSNYVPPHSKDYAIKS